MTDKEKIIEVIALYVSAWGDDEAIADALIAAGIGDVSKWETLCKVLHEQMMENMREERHRAEVAERALKDRATYCATYCVMEEVDCFSLTSVAIEARAKELYKGWERKAEKELSEGERQ